MFVERRDEKVEDDKGARTVTRETLIFPRYHQLDAVGRLVAVAAADGPRAQLSDPALRRQRQDQQHLVALTPTGEPARRRRRQGLSLRGCHHRPPRAGPAAAGRHLPDRARAGRGEGHRPGFKATGECPGGRDDDRHHHAAEVPLCDAGAPVHRRRRRSRRAQRGRAGAGRGLAQGDLRPAVCGDRGRGAFQPDGG